MFAKYPGVLVERQYNPFVKNPKSTAQSEQRAKMKLASQLSAIFGKDRLSGFKPVGTKSSRNLFVEALFGAGALDYTNGQATITMNKVKLTSSRVDYFRGIEVTRSSSVLTVTGNLLSPYVDKVVGVRVIVTAPRTLGATGLDMAVIGDMTVVPEDGTFTAAISGVQGTLGCNVFVYAYCIADTRAYVRYTDLVTTGTSEAVALDVVRTESPNMMDYSVTIVRTVAAE